MLELLINPRKAKRHYLEMFVLGFFYATISVILGFWVFQSHSSIAIVFLTVLSCVYVIHRAMRIEEKLEENYNSEKWLIRHHMKLFTLLLFLFLGFLLSFSLFSLFLPEEINSKIFEVQNHALENIRPITGNAIGKGDFGRIFFNNLNVLAVSLVFAFVYGAGVIYILVWNSSVMGLVIGNISRNSYGLIALPASLAKFLLHGIPEMLAYIVGSLAGGILYFALIRGDLINKGKTKRIVGDVLVLILMSVALLFVAGLIEVFISAKL